MHTKISEIKEAFYKEFYNSPIILTSRDGADVTVNVRHAEKSSANYTEEELQQLYPCIAIYDYPAELSKKWSNTGHKYYADQRSSLGNNVIDIATAYYEPVFLTFKFDVSFVAKMYNHYSQLEEYFLKNYLWRDVLIIDKKLVGDEIIGESCFLYTKPTKIPRPDGVFEINYEFTFDAWLQVQDPEDVDLITQLNINIAQISN